MNFAEKVSALKKAHLYREPAVFHGPQMPRTVINGREMLLFSSNNYLNLSRIPAIQEKAVAAVRRYGVGAGGSRLTTGGSALHARLESDLAAYKGSEDAVVFASGYAANVGTIAALCGDGDVIFSDALNHASIIDGCRLSGAQTVVYAHNDPDDLVHKITRIRPRSGLVVTDGLFSMDGDVAPLPELARIAREHNLLLMVDDAHATGTLGPTGRGSLEHYAMTCDDAAVVMGTLSKALASEGGFICASKHLCDYVRNSARSYIFSTALSPAAVAAAIGGIEHLRTCQTSVRTLQKNVLFFCEQLQRNGIRPESRTAIQPVRIGDESRAGQASEELSAMGVFVPCIRYPTVKKGEARLRFTLMAEHSCEDMEYAVTCLKNVLFRR